MTDFKRKLVFCSGRSGICIWAVLEIKTFFLILYNEKVVLLNQTQSHFLLYNFKKLRLV